MRRKRGLGSLAFIVVLAALLLTLSLVKGWRPLLGLDLQGGVSVVLIPKDKVDEDVLQQAIEIMRQRIDTLGVAEPEITSQGDNILISIPGVKDKDRALDLVGKTAELRFRPVLQNLPPEVATETTPGTAPPGTAPPGTDVPGSVPTGSVPDATAGGVPPDASTASSTVPPSVAPAAPTTVAAAGPGTPIGESAAGRQTPPPTVTDSAPDPTAVPTPSVPTPSVPGLPTDPVPGVPGQVPTPSIPGIPGTPGTPTDGAPPIDPAQLQQGASLPTTPPDQDDPKAVVVLPLYDDQTRQIVGRYQLGPVELTGKALEGASVQLGQTGEWEVHPVFKDGPEGIDLFNAAAAKCKPPSQTCPTGQLAIALDGRVISAPVIEEKQASFTPFKRDQIIVSGSFTEESARDLATSLKYGSLPVELQQQSSQIVSATLGRDALDAGLVAGAVGLLLAAAYMILWYRLLGVLAILKLAVEGALLWSVISYLGDSAGLALTLAGVTGIIVSIGVSLDSNVVYYEHLREDVRNGRTVRSAVDKSFVSSWSTILKADGASLLGAALLYFLAVGPVRGFAFYLGLATLLDIVAAYCYMRPVVAIATRSNLCRRRPTLFGLPASAAVEVAEPRAARARATAGATRGGGERGRGDRDDGDLTDPDDGQGAADDPASTGSV